MAINEIIRLLNSQKIINSDGEISFNLLNTEVLVSTKDIIGGLLQDWFGCWMTNNCIKWRSGSHAQTWPDFILSDDKHLEFKAFDGTAGPNFDIANFDAFTRSILINPERLDTNHLIFEYELKSKGKIFITNFWVKKIWELTGPSKKNILTLQVKQGVPVNIRPKNWRSPKVNTFSSRLEFVKALNYALLRFHPLKYQNWFKDVENKYFINTGNKL